MNVIEASAAKDKWVLQVLGIDVRSHRADSSQGDAEPTEHEDTLFGVENEYADAGANEDFVLTELPPPPAELSPQGQAFRAASRGGFGLVEVCPVPQGQRTAPEP